MPFLIYHLFSDNVLKYSLSVLDVAEDTLRLVAVQEKGHVVVDMVKDI